MNAAEIQLAHIRERTQLLHWTHRWMLARVFFHVSSCIPFLGSLLGFLSRITCRWIDAGSLPILPGQGLNILRAVHEFTSCMDSRKRAVALAPAGFLGWLVLLVSLKSSMEKRQPNSRHWPAAIHSGTLRGVMASELEEEEWSNGPGTSFSDSARSGNYHGPCRKHASTVASLGRVGWPQRCSAACFMTSSRGGRGGGSELTDVAPLQL